MLNDLVDAYLNNRTRITWIFNKFYDHSIIMVNIEIWVRPHDTDPEECALH